MLDSLKQAVAQSAEANNVPFVSFGATDLTATLAEGQVGGFNGRELTGGHIFRIASMTKPIVTVAVLQLVEAGKLALDAPLKEILPQLGEVKIARRNGDAVDYSAPETDITMHHLLTHTAGFGYSFHVALLAEMEAEGKLPPIASDNDAFITEAPLVFEPGTAWEYGVGIDWAGKAVEAITGQDLNAYVTDNVFAPLGMQNSSFNAAGMGVENIVPLNIRGADGSLTDASELMPPVTKPPYLGGGGIHSNVDDYLKFMRLLLNRGMGPNGRLLGESYADMMLSNQIGELSVTSQPSTNALLVDDNEWFPGNPKRWSYGLLINEEDTGTRRSANSCAWSGLYCTYFFIDPAQGVGGTVMMQMLPCYNEASKAVFASFEEALYQQVRG